MGIMGTQGQVIILVQTTTTTRGVVLAGAEVSEGSVVEFLPDDLSNTITLPSSTTKDVSLPPPSLVRLSPFCPDED
jgi:hypothetical protein